MNISIIVIFAIVLILLGLIHSTESILEIRQRRREQGDDPKKYL